MTTGRWPTAALARRDRRSIPDDGAAELRLFMVVRDEALRLPYFLSYYFARGVDRVFAIDNGSTDDTLGLLLADPRCHVFTTEESFDASMSGREWILSLLARYGQRHWCIVADADEILVYPGWESLSLPALAAHLDEAGANGLFCHLLDMYSDRPIRDTAYEPGTDPLVACRFFDADYRAVDGTFHHRVAGTAYPIRTHVGGMRERVFGIRPYCSKVPLLRFDESLVLARGWHDLVGLRSSGLQGAVLHFKWLFDFPSRARGELARPERRNSAHEIATYVRTLDDDPDLGLHHADSHTFTDAAQLVDLGLMKTTPAFESYLSRPR